MPIKSVKQRRQTKKGSRKMRGGSSSLSSSASTFIKRSLGLKRVSDKHCVSESKKLRNLQT